MTAIKLGMRVRDAVTGIEGITDAIAATLHGNRRICICPPMKDDKIVDSVWVDEVGVEILDPIALTAKAVPLAHVGTDRLGEAVRDRVSGFAGIIVDAVFSMNGCVQHGVQGKYDKPGTEPLTCYFDSGRLDKIPEKKSVSVDQTGSGGPRTRGRP